MRLDRSFRLLLYGVLVALFLTGIAWLGAGALRDSPDGELWQAIAADLLMVHGGGAMVMLMLFGALFPLHVRHGWRRGKNRVLGSAMVAVNAALVITAFGLYYAGSDVMRPWISAVHLYAGLCLPALMLTHVLLGRYDS